MEHTYDVFGKIDAVINCAALFDIEPMVYRAALQRFYTVPQGFFTNLLGSFYTSYFYTLLKGDGPGVIINVRPMINDEELSILSVFFKSWFNVNSLTSIVTKFFNKMNIRLLSISPSSMDTLIPNINVYKEKEKTRSIVMDSVIKRYRNHEDFVNLVIYCITNSQLNGVELELDNYDFISPPMVAKI